MEHEESTYETEAATEDDTRAALLERSNRPFAPIGKVFVQAPQGNTKRHGPLSQFVRKGDLRGLRAQLLLYGIISSDAHDDGWSTTLPIQVWARAFDTTRTASPQSAANAASKILARLEERQLVIRARKGRERNVRVTLLREDGSGKPYQRPSLNNEDRFFRLPHIFWTDGWYEQLDLPATAMLLVALHEKPGFQLPTEKVPLWYGWSADTAERGFKRLEDLHLLKVTPRVKKAPLSPTGLAKVNEYTLAGPFGHEEIKVLLDRHGRARASKDQKDEKP
ncbi:conserved hypothetical protein [Arthrobacter sp. Hiyo1]|uniref:hypothetical protein n=1 Tax=Arthrobacter sp. Hiyo1 TaxID=1588020 RepID=UPI0006A3BA7F|nr:hypothetical protein [Arthrobacter sp. Hiyo1]GAP61414.1 conserved hypothetical protein [Arthrobacter sp. Hiyo1]